MSKKFKIVFSVIFFTLCTLPLVLMPFLKNDPSIEKREFARFPAYVENGKLNTDFGSEFESWYNDRIPLRANLLSMANFIKGETFKAETSNVMIGKEGWLFYQAEASDYMDTSAMNDSQIRSLAVTLDLIQETVEERGGHFTFVAMPNKSSVYPEYVGDNYRKADENNLTRVNVALADLGVNHVDMKEVLTEARMKLSLSSYIDPDDKDGPTLYHRRDSHWNYMGALIGYDAIMTSLGRDHDSHEGAEYTIKYDWRGDLDKLVYPAWGTMDKQYYYDIDHADFRFTEPRGVKDQEAQLQLFMSDKEQGDDFFTIRNMELKDGSKLYMARDSYGRALLPYIKDDYEYSSFKRTDCPDIANLEEGTDLVYEIGERNLYKVIATAPFMYAPKRNGISEKGLKEAGKLDPVCESQGYGIRIYGELPESSEEGRVYLRLSKEGEKSVTFEAFPIFESKLLKKEGTCGFSAFISKEYDLQGEYSLKVITDDKVYDCGNYTL